MTNPSRSFASVLRTSLWALAVALTTLAAQCANAQTYEVLHSFSGGGDGGYPLAGVTIDRAGNLYGTTFAGGSHDGGSVYELKPHNGSWTLSMLYSFSGNDGAGPAAGVVFGPDGNLYGTTQYGGNASRYCDSSCGTVFKLRPPAHLCASLSCSWTETVLHAFTGMDGGNPAYVNLVFDQAGNIYGTTYNGGAIGILRGMGTVFELTSSGGNWSLAGIHVFQGDDGAHPLSGVLLDQAGHVFGTTSEGGTGMCGSGTCGTVFQLTRSGSVWAQNFLYSFSGGSDGDTPVGGLIFDSSGNIFGSTANIDTVFQLTPSGGSWSYSLLHTFGDGGGNECGPRGNLVMDSAGNLYGVTYCSAPNGAAFKLTPSGDGNWTYTLLHAFEGSGGIFPGGSVALDANGNLYGTASGGGQSGNGVIWKITP